MSYSIIGGADGPTSVFIAGKKMWKSMALAIIPTLLFLVGGLTMRNAVAMALAVMFGIGHIYVTYKNQE